MIKILVFPPSLLTAGITKLLEDKGFEVSLSEPDVVLVNVGASLHAVTETRARFPLAKLVLLTSRPLPVEDVMRVFQEDKVSGCFDTGGETETLVLLLQVVFGGQVVLPRDVVETLLKTSPVVKANGVATPIVLPGRSVLSEREAQVLALLRQGASNKMIARRLGAAEATVKVHVKSILRKLRLQNRTQAAMWTEIRADQGGLNESAEG